MGAPEVDAQHYVASRSTWWDGGNIANTMTRKGCDDRMPDKDRLFAVLQPVAGTLGNLGLRSHTELDGHGAYVPVQQPVAFTQNQREEVREIEVPGALAAEPGTHQQTYVAQSIHFTKAKRGLRSHTELDGHTAHVPVEQSVAFEIYGGNKRVDRPEGGFYVRQADTARTLDAAQGLNPTCSQGGTCITQQVPFTQAKRAQSTTDDETWVDGQVNPTQRCSAGRGADDQRTCVAFSSNMSEPDCETDGTSPTVKVGSGLGIPSPPAVAHAVAPTITAANDPSRSPQSSEVTQRVAAVHAASMTVRRLTPRECERLQGFPDDYTAIPWRGKAATECPDGPRYKALGNSMAVNCMAWIGKRIQAVDDMIRSTAPAIEVQ